jgi:aspartyl-tRNA(Asn)/glutamyl-tRNA(Gln) amidotransferase subunit B
MRGKEEAHDYRYFPDPDLVPLEIGESWIEEIRRGLPELPSEKKDRFIKQYQPLTPYDCEVLTSSKSLANYFEESVKLFPKPKEVSNWVMGDLLRELNRSGGRIEKCLLSPCHLAEMLKLLDSGTITRAIAQNVFEKMYMTGKRAEEIVEEEGLQPVVSQLENAVIKILAEYPDEVEQYRAGKEKLIGFFMGKVMRATSGKADPKLANQLFKEKLKGRD